MADGKSGEQIELVDKDLEVLDDIEGAPAIYIDGAQGMTQLHGVVKINLYQVVQSIQKDAPQPPFKKVVVGRLIMSPEVARSLSNWLGKNLAEMAGGNRAEAPESGKPSNGD